MKTPQPGSPVRVVIPRHSWREIALVVIGAAALFGFIGWGVSFLFKVQRSPSANHLRGTITAKHDLGEREELVSIGRQGLRSREGESGYSFDVRVESGRTYEVPVSKAQFDTKKVGDPQEFLRPHSEQR